MYKRQASPRPSTSRTASSTTEKGTIRRSASSAGSTEPWWYIWSSSQLEAGLRSSPAVAVIRLNRSRRASRVPRTDSARLISSSEERSTGLRPMDSERSGAVTVVRSFCSRRNSESTKATTATGTA